MDINYQSILEMGARGDWESLHRYLQHEELERELLNRARFPINEQPYERELLFKSGQGEVLLIAWAQDHACLPHDHGDSNGVVFFIQGDFQEDLWQFNNGSLAIASRRNHQAKKHCPVIAHEIHSMKSSNQGISLHIYFPTIQKMKVYDIEKRRTLVVSDDCGAWAPADSEQILESENWPQSSLIWITYTTEYREGGAKFEQVAKTMAKELRESDPRREIIREAIESKNIWRERIEGFIQQGKEIHELHFIGHSGLYGIMFGSNKWPEQMSPFEWKNLTIPFAKGARAYFHACRTARWFAPFFSQTYQVKSYGYYRYTTFSLDKDKFRWEGLQSKPSGPLYVVSCSGRTSHGLLGSALKYSGISKTESLVEFQPTDFSKDRSYDKSAALYDKVFADIRVRRDEWRWLTRQLPNDNSIRVLDIGCGNGSLLKQLSSRIGLGVGVDISQMMIKAAKKRCNSTSNLSFCKIDSPNLPFDEDRFDIVISFMSFRYLDWDPVLKEIKRVLSQRGRLLIVDMVAAPIGLREIPRYLDLKFKQMWHNWRNKEHFKNLRELVGHPEWKSMLKYNPIRAEHEYRMYLESRFPDRRLKILNVGLDHRVVAFDSGDFSRGKLQRQTFP